MRELKLKALGLGATEVLTRDQLKKVLGGFVAPPACTNACGGTAGTCASGKTCKSEKCPDDPSFEHNICVDSAA
jgi:hypothetical protein